MDLFLAFGTYFIITICIYGIIALFVRVFTILFKK